MIKSIAIIGAGFTGTMTAVHLLKSIRNPLTIYLIDENEFGRGLAYKDIDDSLLLNVPADLMGAYPDEIDHFYKWLKKKNLNVDPKSFISRTLYGNYLVEELETALSNKSSKVNLEMINDSVIGIDSQQVIFKNHETIKCDEVILATGFQKERKWTYGKGNNAPVTILGTGLSMVDAIIRLQKMNPQLEIHAVSRHGYLPQSHKSFSKEVERPVYDALEKHSLAEILKIVKDALRIYDWRLVIDGIRPFTQKIWAGMSESDRSKFLRYIRPLWDVHRHRISSEHHDLLSKLQENGKLKIIKIGFKPFKPPSGIIIDCRGPSLLSDILIKSLIEKGLVTTDKFKLGLVSREKWLHITGTLRKGDLWESTAVPELRVLAKDMANTLIGLYGKE